MLPHLCAMDTFDRKTTEMASGLTSFLIRNAAIVVPINFWILKVLTMLYHIVSCLLIGLCDSSLLRIKCKIYKIYVSKDVSSSVFRPTQVDPAD
jgi:hypothetical protein